MKKFVIISSNLGFVIQHLTLQDIENLNCIVAVYDNEDECKAGLKRAKELEVAIRPMWLAALQHANKLESLMLDAVYAIAKPLAKESEPG
jgi:hypothetical protein